MSSAMTMTVPALGSTERREFSLDSQAFELLSRSRRGQGFNRDRERRGESVVRESPCPGT